jgi:predicted nucleic acid-binding Zn ribbon protein
MKERRVRCKGCGERFTVVRFDRERTSAYCDLCQAERTREQARERMRALRARRRAAGG